MNIFLEKDEIKEIEDLTAGKTYALQAHFVQPNSQETDCEFELFLDRQTPPPATETGLQDHEHVFAYKSGQKVYVKDIAGGTKLVLQGV